MKQTLATFVIGDRFQTLFRDYCASGWQAYAERHRYDLHVLDRVIDDSPRGRSRSVSWQKCILLEHSELSRYDRVVWIDADVIINPDSPDIGDGVPLDKIGAVDEYATPSRDVHRRLLSELYDNWRRAGISYIDNLAPEDFHHAFGLPEPMPSVVQAGVMVLSPAHHTALLRHVYDAYEDKGNGWNYEMRPLSYEIQRAGAAHWLDPRFNMLWLLARQQHYPFVDQTTNPATRHWLLRKCATRAWLNSYFLHFAASSHEMGLVESTGERPIRTPSA